MRNPRYRRHHLGLYHTFGKGNTGTGCTLASDDGVADTPIVAGGWCGWLCGRRQCVRPTCPAPEFTRQIAGHFP